MVHGGDGGLVEQHDWDDLLDGISIPEGLTFVNDELPDSASLLSIEELLMNDDDDHHLAVQQDQHVTDDFFSDLFLDFPVEDSSSDKANESSLSQADDSSCDKGNDSSSDRVNEPQTKEDNVNGDVVVEQEETDPIEKKRKRQLRNRDAAVRSRERKKMYVRDLEMKSKYFEAECRRLGMLLQCCIAENHALRFSLHNSKAVDASMTKQESAVLLLESLLLGSLLWFLGIICLFVRPRQLQSILGALPLDNVYNASQSLGLGKQRSKIFRNWVFRSSMMGKRCKASRSRMKLMSCAREVKVHVMENAPPCVYSLRSILCVRECG